jgi:hypothetical protein
MTIDLSSLPTRSILRLRSVLGRRVGLTSPELSVDRTVYVILKLILGEGSAKDKALLKQIDQLILNYTPRSDE